MFGPLLLESTRREIVAKYWNAMISGDDNRA
jgi:hypothetical protein